jgi:hypothetical protein
MSVTALQHLLHAVHLEGQHAFRERHGEDLGDARVLLMSLLDRVGAHQQLVQARRDPCSRCRRRMSQPFGLVELEVGLAEAVVLEKRSKTFL